MAFYVISGNRQLSGEVEISGSKNAALPIIFSTISVNGVLVLRNVPNITDVAVALELLEFFGAKIVRAKSTVTIDTRRLFYKEAPRALTSKIRASTYLMGACLARFGVADIGDFGGCSFATRPIDMHLYAFERLSARVADGTISARELVGGEIYFDKVSVGATVNAVIAASRASGVTNIYNPAIEPHVISLIGFLKKCGIKIEVHKKKITVYGGEGKSAEFTVIPDMIEAGTFLALSYMTNSKIKIKGLDRRELDSFIAPIESAGGKVDFYDGFAVAGGEIRRPIEIETGPYPAFPTDLQPIIAPLLLKNSGGKIREGVWQGRFGYLSELAKLGARYTVEDDVATLYKSNLHSASVSAPDLRGGAGLVITALALDGVTVIDNAELIMRGYESLPKKLSLLGAEIALKY